ncbi:aldehyde dehydrogenase family protein (plasmid) [Aliiroseovarius crassostreae]|uniref:Aldehyde dehydrogenase family protein n=3 Tax=Aliiroseovarius TaxID=1658781 RepID=A0A9Q9LUC7_9RHOB|nr:aldehyde dehydrogenase family protein [Aliiroseovarius crassostreae]UWP91527.1 aldehyde dehydrogenase family protein [Aliiroseovarius crassostreae]UWP94008.1 aldehyde dehydrogenase family protein [Aliiroseovarius crassostreae]UWP94681.1 aldehyde dehydrogenase family protein [Aliiroseovarius crassostreae]UWP97156.1 aldehyde dehydrogenase family protein [Aliiroseovarius crassostreae]UWP97839.1 aldehyde dehydrogenase family protein [Aliiroseovarius crassostreae]
MKRNLIAGEWLDGVDAVPNLNPADLSDVIGTYAHASVEQVNDAVAAANAALPAWANASPQLRSDLLEAVAGALLARKDEIGTILAREEGKTLAEAIGETVRAAQIFRFFAGEAIRVTGDAVASVRPDVDVEVSREPVGVVGLITPWNFPIAIPAWKIAPALAYGNAVVFKPADLTPGSAHLLAEILHEAGVPAGIFNLVMGRGSVVGQAIVDHPGVTAISFTGSVPVGRNMAVDAARGMKKLQMEMGGKNPMVILDDAEMDIAVSTVLNGAFFSTGQRCTASSRIIVQAGIHDAFVERLAAEMQALTVGNPLDVATQIGPVVSENQLNGNLGYVDLARSEGAEVIGGERLNRDTEGFFQAPAMFVGATNQMRSSREEIFGPCASIIKVADFDEALATANDTEFGLSAGICTASLKHARSFKHNAQAGMVMVNLPTAGVDYHVPFGGTKASSYGAREQGKYAAEFYSTVKTKYCCAG